MAKSQYGRLSYGKGLYSRLRHLEADIAHIRGDSRMDAIAQRVQALTDVLGVVSAGGSLQSPVAQNSIRATSQLLSSTRILVMTQGRIMSRAEVRADTEIQFLDFLAWVQNQAVASSAGQGLSSLPLSRVDHRIELLQNAEAKLWPRSGVQYWVAPLPFIQADSQVVLARVGPYWQPTTEGQTNFWRPRSKYEDRSTLTTETQDGGQED